MSPCESRGVSRGSDGEEPTARRGSHHLLRLRRPLQEQLDGRRQHLQLDLRRFLLKSLQEALEELVSVVDALRVLSDDPDHRGLRLGLVQGVKVLAQRSDDRLVAIRELPEDVLDDDHSLLHHVVDLGLNQLKQHVDAAFGSSLEFDGAAPNRTHSLAHSLFSQPSRWAEPRGELPLQLATHFHRVVAITRPLTKW